MIRFLDIALLKFFELAFVFPAYGDSQGMTRKEIIKELNVFKERLNRLETELVKKDFEAIMSAGPIIPSPRFSKEHTW